MCFAGLETVHPPPDETHWLLAGAQDFHDVIEKDYYKFFTEDHSWDRKWDVKNSWVRFHFEEEQSMLVFAIAFSEYIQPMTDWHPKYPEDEEWLKLPLSERHYT